MCKPLSEGGQRCAAHTRPAFEEALSQLREIDQNHGDPTQRLMSLMKLEESATAYASTPEGETAVTMVATQYGTTGNVDRAALLLSAVEKGKSRRMAAQETKQMVREAKSVVQNDGTTPPRTRQNAPRPAAAVNNSSSTAPSKKALVNTYPARKVALLEADALYQARHAEALAAFKQVMGRPCREDACGNCTHEQHGELCTTQVPNKTKRSAKDPSYLNCGCRAFARATSEQIRAAEIQDQANIAFQKLIDARKAAQALEPGDLFVVARGKKVEHGTRGAFIRAFEGEYGQRVLLKNTQGEEFWISLGNLDRVEE